MTRAPPGSTTPTHGAASTRVRALTEPLAVTCSGAGDCDDANVCTTDACPGGFCSRRPACDDANACTTDTCTAGSCTHAALAYDDGLACTTDTCDACLGPTHVPTSTTCNDTCANAVTLRFGQSVAGSTVGRTADYNNQYCASGYNEPGKDVVYKIWLDPPTTRSSR